MNLFIGSRFEKEGEDENRSWSVEPWRSREEPRGGGGEMTSRSWKTERTCSAFFPEGISSANILALKNDPQIIRE